MNHIPLDDAPIYRAMSDEKFSELLADNDPRPMDERAPIVGAHRNPLGVLFAFLAGAAIVGTVVSFIASVLS